MATGENHSRLCLYWGPEYWCLLHWHWHGARLAQCVRSAASWQVLAISGHGSSVHYRALHNDSTAVSSDTEQADQPNLDRDEGATTLPAFPTAGTPAKDRSNILHRNGTTRAFSKGPTADCPRRCGSNRAASRPSGGAFSSDRPGGYQTYGPGACTFCK